MKPNGKTGLEQVQELLEHYKKHRPKCAYCQQPLTIKNCDMNDGHPQQSPKGPCCDDCYFSALGDLVEEFPISSPVRRR